MFSGCRRRREPDALARADGRVLAGADAVAGRAMQVVRRRCEWLRARRRLRHGRPQAAARRRAGRRSRRRRHPRDRDQPGRPHQRPDRAERPVAAARAPQSARALRPCLVRRAIRRSARHRHAARRSDRDTGALRHLRRGPRADAAALRRIREDEHRPSRSGRWRHGRHQDRPRASRTHDSGASAFRAPESGHRSRRGARHDSHDERGVAGCRSPGRGRQLIRLRRHKCARAAGGRSYGRPKGLHYSCQQGRQS